MSANFKKRTPVPHDGLICEENIIEILPEPFVVLDKSLRVRGANSGVRGANSGVCRNFRVVDKESHQLGGSPVVRALRDDVISGLASRNFRGSR